MKSNVNFRDMNIVLADDSAFFCKLVQSVLRGFGANRILEFHDVRPTLHVLGTSKVDLLICDLNLPPTGGLEFAHNLRMNPSSPARTVPILLLTNDTSVSTVLKARDAGANMILAKPFSPISLYERLAWIAFHPRNFIDSTSYFGPDRRFKFEGYSEGEGRRAGDQVSEIADSTGPNLSQSDIDSLLNAARTG